MEGVLGNYRLTDFWSMGRFTSIDLSIPCGQILETYRTSVHRRLGVGA